MIKNEQITELDALSQAWEEASTAAISAQNERDAKLRLYLVGLGEPVDHRDTQLLEALWLTEATKREALENLVREYANAEFDHLSLMQA